MMKKYLPYPLLLLTAFFTACSQTSTDASETSGGAALRITGTRSDAAAGYDPLDDLVVCIYSDYDRLLRRYASRADLPERLELLRGDYRVTVQAGEPVAASFDKRYYEGEQTFRIEAGATTPVEVVCKRMHVAAALRFEQSVADNFSRYTVLLAAAEEADEAQIEQGSVPSLQFTADATGYFLLPEGVSTLAWMFEGEHLTRGPQTKSGKLTGLKNGDNCSLGFRFSPDLPGFIEFFTIRVDPDTDNMDDTIVWTDISIEGDGFDMDRAQEYIPGKTDAKSYTITHASSLSSVTLETDGSAYDLLTDAPEGITLERTDDRHLTLKLTETFLDRLPGGARTFLFRITDRKGGELKKESHFRIQGLLPIDKQDWNLWSRSLTLRALVLEPDIRDVRFVIRSANGDDQIVDGIRSENELFTATFAPHWSEKANHSGLICHIPDDKGITVATSYTCTATVGGSSYETSLETPAGDPIYNAGMDLWSTYSVVGSVATGGTVPFPNENESTAFWVGGNNAQTNSLCTEVETEGSNGRCAQLKPMVVAGVFAAGNLFTGTFDCGTGLLDMYGHARFGHRYAFTARPRGLRLRYNATVEKVTHKGESSLTPDDVDSARIFVCITDWTERHAVKSGKSFDEKTFWDPETAVSVDEGPILGYGSRMLGASTGGWVTDLIPIRWYDKDTAPAAGNYSLVISCVTSYKGDYVAGSTNNVLFVEDFEWVY